MATPREKAQCVSWFIETKSDLRRLSETLELSMKEIHHYVHQFVHDTRNLWRQRQCSIKGRVDQEHLRKTSIVQEIEYRLDVLCATNGARVRVY